MVKSRADRRVWSCNHPPHRSCTWCEPYVSTRPRLRAAAELTALQLVAGLALGAALAAAIDALTAGPGLGVIIGWAS